MQLAPNPVKTPSQHQADGPRLLSLIVPCSEQDAIHVEHTPVLRLALVAAKKVLGPEAAKRIGPIVRAPSTWSIKADRVYSGDG